MNGPYYIISDNHFSMDNNTLEKNRRDKLFSIFNKIKKLNKGTLIIGGDFFDYWFEYKNEIPKGYQSILDALKDLTNHGIQIHYILGNHDYWDFGYLSQMTGVKIYNRDLYFTVNDKSVLITHGDGILKKDHLYRIMKKIIRSNLFIFIYRLFPAKITCRLAKLISKSSSDYNHHDRFVDIIREDTLNYAQKKWKENFDIVCIGHYHQTGINNIKDKKLIYLGDWLSKFTVTIIDDQNCWQGDWKQFLNHKVI
jgi:UDP-2,3-diacylglucosamine hydrolase